MQLAQVERNPLFEPHTHVPRRLPRRRRIKISMVDIVERALQYEYRSIAMFRRAAEKTNGPISSLFRRMAKEEEYQIEYFREWYQGLSEATPIDEMRLAADRERMELAAEVHLAHIQDYDNKALMDFVIDQERRQRDFYLKQRHFAKGKKMRAVLLDLADEENIHLDQLLEAGGYPPQPRLETEEFELLSGER